MTSLARRRLAALVSLLGAAQPAAASGISFGWSDRPIGYAVLAVFVAAYVFVVLEERIGLRKSKPVLLAAAVIWALIAWQAPRSGLGPDAARDAFRAIFLDFAELFFFLIVAMSYVSAISERNVFEALRAELTSRRLSYRQLFWITGVVAFFMSAALDNLTTALVMSGVILAVGAAEPRFTGLALISLVVAANAGGAWCAFGDLTTLMVWQHHRAAFFDFFWLIPAALVNFAVPAACMHFAVPKGTPLPGRDDADIKPGGRAICALFGLTIVITVAAKHWLGLPPVFGMMGGLALLNVLAWWIARTERRAPARDPAAVEYSIFRIIARAEWDTLLFFYGVLLCVGGLAAAGWLALASQHGYASFGPTVANVAMGVLSALVDNIPIMYAILEMDPPMGLDQWLLITLTAGVGGSLLAVGSAAGVALMGVARGRYTFISHLRWTWAIALGYVASIVVQRATSLAFFGAA